MLQIGRCENLRIIENRSREIKGNTVFPQIRIRFHFVPLELELPQSH
jgi:hypothetical protein